MADTACSIFIRSPHADAWPWCHRCKWRFDYHTRDPDAWRWADKQEVGR